MPVANKDQLDIRQLADGSWRLEFDYNSEFIEYLKQRVPARDRHYDDVTHYWTIFKDEYMPAIEGIAVQKFAHVTKIFWRDDKEVWRNLKTGVEYIQENLFS